MRLNHLQVPKDFEDRPLMDGPDQQATYRSLCIVSLNTVSEDEKLGAEAKARCYQLSLKFFKKNNTVELTVDEASFIKERAGRILSPLAFGRLSDWLEGKSDDDSDDNDKETDEVSNTNGRSEGKHGQVPARSKRI